MSASLCFANELKQRQQEARADVVYASFHEKSNTELESSQVDK